MRSPVRVAFSLLVMLLSVFTLAARTRTVKPRVPTFSKDVARILQDNCQSCHRPGDVAPFPLLTYADAKAHAEDIAYMTATRQMPPWKPTAGCGEFAGERRLSDADIATIAAWVNAGAPEGDPRELPPPREFSSEWALGTPDLELKMPETFTAPTGNDTYRCFTLPTPLTSDAAVIAMDTRPGNRETVHHVLAFLDTTGVSVQLDEAEAGPGYTCFGGPGFTPGGSLGGWAPGMRPQPLQDGIAMQLPRTARVVLQVHYHPHHGTPEPDQTAIALYFSKTPVKKWLRILPLANTLFTIPPEAQNYRVTAGFQVPAAAQVWAIAPHMHLLGKKIRVEAFLPDGSSKCMVNIDEWDFNWQGLYIYRQPVSLPAGTYVSMDAYYDNSSTNPRNPNNPPKPVSWGEQTTDEMALTFLGFTLDSENVTQGN